MPLLSLLNTLKWESEKVWKGDALVWKVWKGDALEMLTYAPPCAIIARAKKEPYRRTGFRSPCHHQGN